MRIHNILIDLSKVDDRDYLDEFVNNISEYSTFGYSQGGFAYYKSNKDDDICLNFIGSWMFPNHITTN